MVRLFTERYLRHGRADVVREGAPVAAHGFAVRREVRLAAGGPTAWSMATSL